MVALYTHISGDDVALNERVMLRSLQSSEFVGYGESEVWALAFGFVCRSLPALYRSHARALACMLRRLKHWLAPPRRGLKCPIL